MSLVIDGLSDDELLARLIARGRLSETAARVAVDGRDDPKTAAAIETLLDPDQED